MNSTPLRLYSFALSPYAQKVKCYLLYKELDHETVFVNPMRLRKDLPIGTMIPVLSHDGESRNESSELGVWLDALYPERKLIPEGWQEKILKADTWVTERLIPLAFRYAIAHDTPLLVLIKQRWWLSGILNRTVPGGVSVFFRLLHLLSVGSAPFVKALITSTDTSKQIDDIKIELAEEFEALLEGGPFIAGSPQATLADLSAYPQITTRKLLLGDDYFLPGNSVHQWVSAMEAAVPQLVEFLPETIKPATN